nr:Transposable element Tcb1 transposase [Haemonchus contortus]
MDVEKTTCKPLIVAQFNELHTTDILNATERKQELLENVCFRDNVNRSTGLEIDVQTCRQKLLLELETVKSYEWRKLPLRIRSVKCLEKFKKIHCLMKRMAAIANEKERHIEVLRSSGRDIRFIVGLIKETTGNMQKQCAETDKVMICVRNRISTKIVAERRNFGGGSLMVLGAFSAAGQPGLAFVAGRMDSVEYQRVQEERLLPLLRQHRSLIFMHDNAAVHVSRSTSDWIASRNIAVLEWPARSPDLNSMENVWASIVKKIYDEAKQYNTAEEDQPIIKKF